MSRKYSTIIVFGVVLIGVLVLFQKGVIAPGNNDNGDSSLTPEPNIIIDSPRFGQSVGNPITVSGRARVFERTFQYRLKDANGEVLYKSINMTGGPDLPDYGTFTVKIPVPAVTNRNVTVEVFEYSAKDGSIINLVRVPVVLTTLDTALVKVFFNNDKLDPEVSCIKVFPVERRIIKTREVAFTALAELLKGPTISEKAQSYGTSLPSPAGINSISIRNGTAYTDFDYRLEFGAGGSCRVSAIRAQITETLKQFSSVKSVVISIDGRTEDILQP